ncbi:MAG: hypothetical protein J6331_00570, partial [Lentisphaeria bacterium]|nr:hypothetical protein [Lentisphaeria bacterium]
MHRLSLYGMAKKRSARKQAGKAKEKSLFPPSGPDSCLSPSSSVMDLSAICPERRPYRAFFFFPG